MTGKRRSTRLRNRAGQPHSSFQAEPLGQQSSCQLQHSPSFNHEPSLPHQRFSEDLRSPDGRHSPSHLQTSSAHPISQMQQPVSNLQQTFEQPYSFDPPRLPGQEVPGVSQLPEVWLPHSLQQYSAIPVVLPPMLYRKITMLDNSLWLRPAEAARTRLIAVDGFDQRAAQRIVRYLLASIRRHTNITVRVFEPIACSTIFDFILEWARIWDFLISTPFPPTTLRESFDQEARSQSSTAFCVNIVPFSPLMMSLRAAPTIYTHNEMNDMKELENWQLLASYWMGKIRADVTINVFDANSIPHDPGVVRIAGYDMVTLAVAKVPWEVDAIDGLTPAQLRRIDFEVMQCLLRWRTCCGNTASVQD